MSMSSPSVWVERDHLLFRELLTRNEVRILAGRMNAFLKMELQDVLPDGDLAEISKHLELVADVARKTSDLLARIVNSERT